MPSNNTGAVVKALFNDHPNRLALMMNPNCIRPCQFRFPYAVDNAAFIRFESEKFFKLLDFSMAYHPPMFVVCPDVVGCHDRTLALWHYYHPLLRVYGYKVAFVAQNGCCPESVPKDADVVFVGGLDPWKMDNVHKFLSLGKPVHVGRVNSLSRLKYCEEIGVTSVDGTGWLRDRDKKYYDLLEWFAGETKQLFFC